MPHVVVDVDADVPAEQMLAAATDFSERRPDLWPNISREFWQLHDRGSNWAEATEGSPAVWARERYEWSDNRVVGTTQDSNVWQPGGTWTLTVEPRNGRPTNVQEEPAEDVERARVEPFVRRAAAAPRFSRPG